MTRSSFDVAIIGAGPGGSATALSLRANSPSLSVVLIEASHFEALRIGETLPPLGRSILGHLGVWNAFRNQGHREVHGTTAAWGRATLLDNNFFYRTANTGWHLDRAAFDAMLAGEAQRHGATVLLDTRVRNAKRSDNEWQLTLSTGNTIAVQFMVDATGGSATLARRCGARFVEADNLVGVAAFLENSSGDPRTLVEAFEEGWWYTAGLRDGRRLIACMTDADLARRMKLHQAEEWQRKLASMTHVGALARRSKVCDPIIVRSSSSRRLEPAAGEHWLAVGDSASRFDPLSSQGILKALRSGIFASYAIGDLLTRDDNSGLDRYRRYVLEEFESYAAVREKYYREEQRWPGSEFWRRRHTAGNEERQSRDTKMKLTV